MEILSSLFGATSIITLLLVGATAGTIVVSMMFRTVVKTNMVHVAQSRRTTTPYGVGQKAGNVYYHWPAWVPYFGITVIKLPISNFDLSLRNYEAYDRDRVPFVVDVVSFFRIDDTTIAAQRVENTTELELQLTQIVQGAVRKVLASDVIDSIMLERAKFGDQFTEEVSEQLKSWGVGSVKAMELMDIRDTADSNVISNIMAKATSFIERQSRVEVAQNMQVAKVKEIEAKQSVDVRAQEAEQAVGERTATKDKKIGMADEQAKQNILSEAKVTTDRQMDVERVAKVRDAQIVKDKEVVAAEQDKQTRVIIAEGELQAEQRNAEAIRVVGVAKADAEKAMVLAPVQAQIVLAKEIGENQGYQEYLISIEAIKANQTVGVEQAQALQDADVKVITTSSKPGEGLSSVGELFTPKGGVNVGSMLEGFINTPAGEAMAQKFGFNPEEVKSSLKAVKGGKTIRSKSKAKTKSDPMVKTVEADLKRNTEVPRD